MSLHVTPSGRMALMDAVYHLWQRSMQREKKGASLNGAIIQILDAFLPDNPNQMARRLYHHNRGYAVGKIVSLPYVKKDD